jgi:flavin-dependent dehydrogenase
LARADYGNGHRVLIGDAAGHTHPLTATGITNGLVDAMAAAGIAYDKTADFSWRVLADQLHNTKTPS